MEGLEVFTVSLNFVEFVFVNSVIKEKFQDYIKQVGKVLGEIINEYD